MKKGFTLAEVLITLGIIGVISALTMPTLVQDVANRRIGPSLFKAVNTFENGNRNMLAALGVNKVTAAGINEKSVKYWGLINGKGGVVTKKLGFDEKIYTDRLTDYIKMSFYQGQAYTDKPNKINNAYDVYNYNGTLYSNKGITAVIDGSGHVVGYIEGTSSSTALLQGQKYLSNDGFLYVIKVTNTSNTNVAPHKQHIGYVHIDINGLTEPNKLGKDVFVFSLQNDGSLKPIGAHGWSGGGNDEVTWESQCNEKEVKDGIYCAGSIFENDKKVIYQ